MKDSINQNYEVTLEILTPVHVGGAQDKHWQKYFDFVYDPEASEIVVFDRKEVFEAFDDFQQDDYIEALSNGTIDRFVRDEGNLATLTRKVKYTFPARYDSNQDEIKAHIRQGGDDKPYIPGSSLKGAIRSILFKSVHAKWGERWGNNSRDYLKNAFGQRTDSNWMRLLRVTDGAFEKTMLYSTKIFNLYGKNRWRAGWKHGRGKTSDRFEEEGFVTVYETLEPGAKQTIRIGFGDTLLNLVEKKKHKHEKLAKDYQNAHYYVKPNALDTLFDVINEHTKAHIDKEMKFFENEDFELQDIEIILDQLYDIYEAIPADNSSCILRLGAGSGFHSITGDWKYKDYSRTLSIPERRGSREIHYKSRKFAFENDGIDGFSFLPMGFVRLTKQDNTPATEAREKINVATDEHRESPEDTASPNVSQKTPASTEATSWEPEEAKDKADVKAQIISIGKPFCKVLIRLTTGTHEVSMSGTRAAKTEYGERFKPGAIVIVKLAVNKQREVAQVSFVGMPDP